MMNYITVTLSNGDFREFWVENDSIDDAVIAIREHAVEEKATLINNN